MYPRYSQTMKMDVTTILFIEFPDLQLHYDPMFDSLYITGTCHFRLYFFFRRDSVVPFFHPLFDLATPYIAITLHVAHPAFLQQSLQLHQLLHHPRWFHPFHLKIIVTHLRQQTYLPPHPLAPMPTTLL